MVGVWRVDKGAKMTLSFKRVTESDAELLLQWRTDPEIAKFMFTDLDNPSVEKQKKWIASLADRKDYRAYMIQDDLTSVGFVSFSEIDFVNKRCSTGLYIYVKEARLKFASTIHEYISYYIFHRLQCNKLMTQILDSNKKAIKLQALLHNHYVGCLQQHIFKNNTFHDVHVYEVLHEDWARIPRFFSAEQLKNAFDDWRD